MAFQTDTYQSVSTRAGLVSVFGGVVWKAVEIAHNISYLREIVLDQPDVAALARFVLHLGPLALISIGTVLLGGRRLWRSRALRDVTKSPEVLPPRREVFTIRERVTTTTVDREVIYRRE